MPYNTFKMTINHTHIHDTPTSVILYLHCALEVNARLFLDSNAHIPCQVKMYQPPQGTPRPHLAGEVNRTIMSLDNLNTLMANIVLTEYGNNTTLNSKVPSTPCSTAYNSRNTTVLMSGKECTNNMRNLKRIREHDKVHLYPANMTKHDLNTIQEEEEDEEEEEEDDVDNEEGGKGSIVEREKSIDIYLSRNRGRYGVMVGDRYLINGIIKTTTGRIIRVGRRSKG